jgi:hypothetical protein
VRRPPPRRGEREQLRDLVFEVLCGRGQNRVGGREVVGLSCAPESWARGPRRSDA